MVVCNEWHDRWFQMVNLVSSWSKDPSTKVGSVIIPKGSDIPVIGWNGFPRGVKDLPERYADRNLKYMLVSHAEENTILNAARNGIDIKAGTIYISAFPCHNCSKSIVQSGLEKVFYRPSSKEFLERWGDSIAISELILNEGGVRYECYEG